MAKPSIEITKSQFTKDYNITEVLTSKTSIMSRLKTFNEKKQAVAFGDKKPPRDTMPAWFKKWNKEVFEKVIKLNNLKTK